MDSDINRINKVQKGPRACATCARAKSRCIPGPEPDGGRCERCHRLDKPCSSQTPAPPRKRKEPRPTRMAELERRLEGLTARMESSAATHHTQGQSASPPSSEEADPDRTASQSHLGANGRTSTTGNNDNMAVDYKPIDYNFPHIFATDGPLLNHVDMSTAPPTSTPSTLISDSASSSSSRSGLRIAQPHPSPLNPLLWPEEAEAEAMLALYHTTLGHLFPFTVMDRRAGSRELREKRPFVWKAAMTAAYHLDGPRQMALGNTLLKEIIEAAILKPQKDIDLLQSLQLFLCWFHYNLNSFQLTNLVFLVRSICSSLGLAESTHLNSVKGNMDLFTPKCLDNMRALLGTYYIVTTIFTTNKKLDALMNTSCPELCCEILEKLRHSPSDELVVWLVRIQQLTQTIVCRLALCNSDSIQPDTMPLGAVIRDFEHQIQAFKESLPSHIAEDPTMTGHIYVSQILLYEVALQPSPPPTQQQQQQPPPNCNLLPTSSSSPPHRPPNTTTTKHPLLSPLDKLTFLWSCVHAAKGFLVNRYSDSSVFPSPQHHHLSSQEQQAAELEYRLRNPKFMCMSSTDFIYTFLTALKLIMLQLPGWDLESVRRELRFGEFLERQCCEMEAIAERRQGQFARTGREGPVAYPADGFVNLAKKMRCLSGQMRAELDSTYIPITSPSSQPDLQETQTVPSLSTADEMADQLQPPSLDNATQDLLRDLEQHMLYQDLSMDWNSLALDGVYLAGG